MFKKLASMIVILFSSHPFLFQSRSGIYVVAEMYCFYAEYVLPNNNLNKGHVPRYSITILLPCSANNFQESDCIIQSKILTICMINRFYLYFIFSFCLLYFYLM
jgi:hypothetical protein